MTDNKDFGSAGQGQLNQLVAAFAVAPDVPLDQALPPREHGVFGFLFEGRLRYIGEAKGRKGLNDGILSKHLSGDEGHALQRVFQGRFPDRLARRAYLRRAIRVRWLVVPSSVSTGPIKRALIALHKPDWNQR